MNRSIRGNGRASDKVSVRRARRWAACAAAVRWVEALEARRLLAVTVSGDIRVPGESDSFNFNFATPRRLYFDALTNESRLRWSLDGPGGAVVSGRAFTSSDAQSVNDPVVRVPAGSYSLTVDADADLTAAYEFRLLDLAEAAALTPGAVVFGTLVPRNETDAYALAATAGDAFTFDSLGTSNLPNARWRLLDPFGNVVFHHAASQDVPNLTLGATGTYTLLVEGWVGDTGTNGSYTFRANFLGNTPPTPYAGTPLALGTAVGGNVSAAAEIDSYVFTLGSERRVAFDALSNSPSLRWSLVGPPGLVVNGRHFQQSDSYDFANPAIDLPAGTYRVDVSGNGGTGTGAYGFRVLDFAAAAALTPGTPVSATLGPATETDVYRLDVPAGGGRYYFDVTASPGNATWRLIDPLGNVRFSHDIGTDQDTLALPLPGAYHVVVEGRYNAGAAAANYAFNVHPVVDGDAPLALGATAAGAIGVPGEADRFTFTLAAPTRVAFDSLTDDFRLSWGLVGPGGTAFAAGRGFANSDSFDGDPVLDLPAGAYALTVGAAGDATGPYQFRLLDFASATALTPGVAVNGTLTPGNETDLYRFTVATAGDRFQFDGTAPAMTGTWRLIAPDGSRLFQANVQTDQGPLALGLTGEYTLMVEGYRSSAAAQAYGFTVVPQGNTPPTPAAGTVIAPGATVTGSIGAVAETDNYQFTLASPTTLTFDSLLNDATGALRWTLTGPGGAVVLNRALNGSDSADVIDPRLVLPAGTYQLSVSASNATSTGPYAFRLLDFAAATAVTPGTPFSGGLTPPNETDVYRFDATAGQRVYFDVQARTGAGSTHWRLYDPNGNFVFNSQSFTQDVDVLPLPLTGAYTLLVEGRYFETAAATYTVNVQPVTDSTTVLSLGSTTAGQIAVPGERDAYTFDLAAAATLYFDSLASDSELRWTLTGPGGTVVDQWSFTGADSVDVADPLLRLAAGSYTLTVDAVGDDVPAYAFRLLNLAAAATAVTPGTPFSGGLTPPNETDAYRFNATAGEQFYFDVEARTGAGSTYWRLYDTHGNLVFGPQSFTLDVDALELPLTGAYTLLVEGRYFETAAATYTVNVRPVAPSTAALTVGSTVTSQLAVPGERDAYTFDLAAPATLYFDALASDQSLRWTLTGPGGTVVDQRSFTGADSVDVADPLLRLAAGAYTVTVDAVGDATPAYAFRLLDLGAAATAVTPGTPFSGALTPPNETDVYSFAGTAGQRMYFDIRARVGASGTYWRLYDPHGNLAFGPQSFTVDVDTLELPLTGAYTLLVEGRYFETAAATYTVNVQPVTDSTTPLALNATATGDVGTAGERDAFTFSLAAAATLYFDALASDQSLRWTLTGPGGTVVDQRAFTGSDSVDVADPMFRRLPAGSYTLTVDAAGDATPAYAFRLLDLATAGAAAAQGVPVAGTLGPANETDVYRFDAEAGDLLYFDVRSRTGATNAFWRLVDPNGNVVFLSNFGTTNTDVDTLAARLTGTYTLLLEGRYFEAAAGQYIVNVQPVGDATLPFVAATGTFNVDQGPNHRVTVAFSQDVSASLGAGDFVLERLSDGALIPVTGVTYDAQNNVATALLNQTLAEGNYRMRLIAAGITDATARALDGDGDGRSGGDYSFDFFYLPGDTNYDRRVDFSDLVPLAQYFETSGRTFTQGDFTYDGVVDFNDLVILAQHYELELPPHTPAPAPAAVPPVAKASPAAAARGSVSSVLIAQLSQAAGATASATNASRPAPPKPAAKPAPTRPVPPPKRKAAKTFSETRITATRGEAPPPKASAAVRANPGKAASR
jgi:predicted RNA-binding protein associated with RNAse of E/G family